jgi:hypothetical protein
LEFDDVEAVIAESWVGEEVDENTGYRTPRFGTSESGRLAAELGSTAVLWRHNDFEMP